MGTRRKIVHIAAHASKGNEIVSRVAQFIQSANISKVFQLAASHRFGYVRSSSIQIADRICHTTTPSPLLIYRVFNRFYFPHTCLPSAKYFSNLCVLTSLIFTFRNDPSYTLQAGTRSPKTRCGIYLKFVKWEFEVDDICRIQKLHDTLRNYSQWIFLFPVQ